MKWGEIRWKEAVFPAILKRCKFLLACVGALSCAAFLGGLHRYLELTCHFRVFYLLGAIILTGALLGFRAWRWSALGLLVIAVNFCIILPWYWPRASHAQSALAPNLRILLCNVLTENPKYEQVLGIVREVDPDILVLLEVNWDWMGALAPLKESYPFKVTQPRSDNFGIALLSRLPLENTQIIEDFGNSSAPAIVGEIPLGGKSLSLVAIHTLPPPGAQYTAIRNAQLVDLAAFVQEKEGPCVVIGDLNTTMWSPTYHRFETDCGLVNTRRGFGVMATWPVGLGPLMIPIDHCLCSPEIQVVDCYTGPDIGSDHLPLIVELSVPGLDLSEAQKMEPQRGRKNTEFIQISLEMIKGARRAPLQTAKNLFPLRFSALSAVQME